MKALAPAPAGDGFPTADALAALRAWYSGLSSRAAVEKYLPHARRDYQSARAIITAIRQQLRDFAASRRRPELVDVFGHAWTARADYAHLVTQAIEMLRSLPEPTPALTDPVSMWLPARAAQALEAANIQTLGDVVPRRERRKLWWKQIPDFGAAAVKELESVLQAVPGIEHSAQTLVVVSAADVVPLERMHLPRALDGSAGAYRAPREMCSLSAQTDLEAIEVWLSLHENASTKIAYRKEAERLALWAAIERGKPLSSLSLEDGIAYRDFLRKPLPPSRWVGPPRPRGSAEWRPFQGGLSPRSCSHALKVLGSLFEWMRKMNYVYVNPFAGLKVKGAQPAQSSERSRALTLHEWTLVRIEADLLDLRHGWSAEAAQRVRFLLDFWVASGLRPSEMVGARLGNIERVKGGDSWLHVRGKGDKPGKVSLTPLAITALERYLLERGLPVSYRLWQPQTPLVPSLSTPTEGITAQSQAAQMKRFFCLAARELRDKVSPATTEKLERVTPHWLRHTHATLSLEAGVGIKQVRDNLRHASITTTSVYLAEDEKQRAKEFAKAFPAEGIGMASRPGP